MSESKLTIKIGNLKFSGEGNQEWVTAQLDKILELAPGLLKLEHPNNTTPGTSFQQSNPENGSSELSKPTNLPAFLRSKEAMTIQVRKFLATAIFLQLNGKNRLTTADVSSLLSKCNQTKINNPTEALNQNVAKGHCSKEEGAFYVTPEGFAEMNISDDNTSPSSLNPSVEDKRTDSLGINLATFLREKSIGSNQNKKFLATAAYIQLKGKDSITSNDVTKALEDSKQGKLSNPALCLIRNTSKGYCDKKGKQFYVTPQGLLSLGINEN